MRELLEREGATVDLEHGHFERMLRRRDRKRRNQRIGAGVLAIIIALVTFVAMTRAFDAAKPPADGSHPRTFTGMVIRYTGNPYGIGPLGDLVAQDPSTGEVITVIDGADMRFLRDRGIRWAAPSADGRWVAFEMVSCVAGHLVKSGLWLTNGTDQPRQLTAPCLEGPEVSEGLWAWSPTGSRLAAVEGGQLILIDAATGHRTELGKTTGDVTSLAWSPDGSRIAYGTVPVGTGDGAANTVRASVYSVDVRSGDHALLANVIGQLPGGEEGSGIRWSPDGRRIAVLGGITEARLYLVKANGSGAELLTEGVNIAHVLGSPNLDWSPDGTRIAYATLIQDRDRLQIWNGSPAGSTPVLVFDPTSSPGKFTLSGGPVWSPDGTQIAFRYDATGEEKGWLVANADGTGAAHEIDELQYLSWRGGWYFCECYG
ncbi:MAG: LpqB family beta-propeller domain-containing protein [Actinomycetota bacterium]|nr:LpqB family beta-propeller domain-containing protein [Actinomycetota bacterium]